MGQDCEKPHAQAGHSTRSIAIPLADDSYLELAPVNVIVGHYGVGKTTLALNFALDASDAGHEVTLIDLDVVNPYFRSSEYRSLLEERGVRLVAPVFSEVGTGLDVPSLTGAILPAIEGAYASRNEDDPHRVVVIDAGGDDVGAATLGRFAHDIEGGEHAVFYLVNPFRNLTRYAAEAVDLLHEIEVAAGIRATAVVGNAHLKEDTDVDTIKRGIAFARDVEDASGLPLTCVTVPKRLFSGKKESLRLLARNENLYPVTTYVRTPWE